MLVVCESRRLATGITTALDAAGREHLVIVTKATWQIPQPGQRPRPLSPQPLSYSDQFYAEPGESALRYGDDFAHHKPRCDVLFDACARPPGGQPVKALAVQVEVGTMTKLIKVLGPRYWKKRLGLYRLSAPAEFTQLPLHYGHAFGGTHSHSTPDGHPQADTYPDNPVGMGWLAASNSDLADSPAPSLEAFDAPVQQPAGHYPAMALSAIARHWPQRMRYAGTCDDAWRASQFPFLPEDFDPSYHQCAPLDQQIDYPRGGEPVGLTHLLADRPTVRFNLPDLQHSVRVLRTDYSVEHLQPPVDTLFFETEANRFSVVWRASTPIRRRIQEIDTVAVGPVDPHWWEARSLGLSADCTDCNQRQEPAA